MTPSQASDLRLSSSEVSDKGDPFQTLRSGELGDFGQVWASAMMYRGRHPTHISPKSYQIL